MTVTVQIDTSTAAGLKLVSELRRHPDIVRFVESNQGSESVPEGTIPVKDGFDELRNHVKLLYKNDHPM